jgi:ATP-dependent Clp endopeptidase proteolytic subunit ClpP
MPQSESVFTQARRDNSPMTEIFLYGIIGDPVEALDAKTIVAAINAANDDLSIRINSAGGFVFEGLPIYDALANYQHGSVTVYIDGLAASMASVIAMAGQNIVMAETALMMIHRPWDSAIGHADDLRKDAQKLDKIESQLVNIYAKRTGLSPAEISQMMDEETWLNAEEALTLGFATEITTPLAIAAMADISACGFLKPPAFLKEYTMPQNSQALAAERSRVSTILALCDQHDFPVDFSRSLIDKGVPVERARAQILDHLAERGDSLMIGGNSGLTVRRGGNAQSLDNPDFHAQAISDAIYARMSGKAPQGAAREFMGSGLVDMARDMLAVAGHRNVLRMRPDEVLNHSFAANSQRRQGGWVQTAQAIHTTSDFPNLLQGAGERFLLDTFTAAGSSLKKAGRQRDAADFRAINGISLSGFGALEKVNEAGEFENGTFTERANSYKLETFGKIFAMTRQAIINDDLGAFSDPLRLMARAAAETEAITLAALLNSNPVLADDQPLFHPTRGNLAAAGAAPTVAAFSAGREAMRNRKDVDGKTMLDATPRFVISGSAQETTIEQNLTPLNPVVVGDVNPFSGKYEQLTDPRLTGNAWYLFADPALFPSLEYAYLNGESGPTLESQTGWRVDGVEFKCRIDFGAGIVDSIGCYKNPGQ